jgi:O-antigen/teichoic acid export membrane protein
MDSFWLTRDWVTRAAKTSGATWAGAGLAVASSVVAARRLGVATYGRVVVAMAICAFIGAFVDISLEEGVVSLGARAIERGDMTQLWSILRTATGVDLAIGILVWVCLFIGAPHLAHLLGQSTSTGLIRIASFTVLFSTINGTTGAVLVLAKHAHLYALSQVIAAASLLIVILLAPSAAEAVLWAYVASAAIGGAVMVFFAVREARRAWGRPSFDHAGSGTRQLVRFGIHSSITTSVGAATDSLVPLLVGSMQGPSAAALFSVAKLPLTVASLATAPVRAVFLPEQARLAARDDVEALRRSVTAYSKAGAALSLCGVAAGWFMLPWLIRSLYGSNYVDAATPARILLIAATIWVTLGWTKILPVAIGRPELRTRTLGVVSILILGGTIVLGGTPTAAATAVSFAYCTYAVLWVWLFHRLLPKGAPEN